MNEKRSGRLRSNDSKGPSPACLRFPFCLLLLAAFLGVQLLLPGCSSRDTGEQDKPIPVEVQLPSRKDVAVTLDFVGEVRGKREANLSFEVSGKVALTKAELSESVSKGAVLAELDDTQARANLAQAELAFAKAKMDAERTEKLHKEGIASDHQLETAHLTMEQARAALTSAEEYLQNCRLVAPFAGFVAARNIELGEVITPMAMPAPNFVLVDISSVKVKIGVPESEIGLVKPGQDVTLKVSAYRDKKFAGRVTAVSPLVSELTRTAETEVLVQNPGGSLKPGMTAELSVRLGTRKNTLVVPEKCVRREVGIAQLFVVKEGRAHHVSVKTGVVEGTWIEVLEGLADTDSVIVAGQFGLKENDKVSVVGVHSGGQGRDSSGT